MAKAVVSPVYSLPPTHPQQNLQPSKLSEFTSSEAPRDSRALKTGALRASGRRDWFRGERKKRSRGRRRVTARFLDAAHGTHHGALAA